MANRRYRRWLQVRLTRAKSVEVDDEFQFHLTMRARELERQGYTPERARQEALAARIRTARATAKQGDIFTAEIRTKFRRLLAPELKGEDGRDAKAVLKEDAPSPASIPFKVNAKYPEGAPLPSVPSNLLLSLPTLPEPLEYRIIGKHLVLLDTAAGIIVDYIPNAIP